MAQREQPDPFLAPDLLPPNFVPPGYAVPNLDNFNYCDNLPGPIDPGTEPQVGPPNFIPFEPEYYGPYPTRGSHFGYMMDLCEDVEDTLAQTRSALEYVKHEMGEMKKKIALMEGQLKEVKEPKNIQPPQFKINQNMFLLGFTTIMVPLIIFWFQKRH